TNKDFPSVVQLGKDAASQLAGAVGLNVEDEDAYRAIWARSCKAESHLQTVVEKLAALRDGDLPAKVRDRLRLLCNLAGANLVSLCKLVEELDKHALRIVPVKADSKAARSGAATARSKIERRRSMDFHRPAHAPRGEQAKAEETDLDVDARRKPRTGKPRASLRKTAAEKHDLSQHVPALRDRQHKRKIAREVSLQASGDLAAAATKAIDLPLAGKATPAKFAAPDPATLAAERKQRQNVYGQLASYYLPEWALGLESGKRSVLKRYANDQANPARLKLAQAIAVQRSCLENIAMFAQQIPPSRRAVAYGTPLQAALQSARQFLAEAVDELGGLDLGSLLTMRIRLRGASHHIQLASGLVENAVKSALVHPNDRLGEVGRVALQDLAIGVAELIAQGEVFVELALEQQKQSAQQEKSPEKAAFDGAAALPVSDAPIGGDGPRGDALPRSPVRSVPVLKSAAVEYSAVDDVLISPRGRSGSRSSPGHAAVVPDRSTVAILSDRAILNTPAAESAEQLHDQ
ncbi:MAG: hypothetical protein ACRYGK_02635, partial [Janthinobacterium lividum]